MVRSGPLHAAGWLALGRAPTAKMGKADPYTDGAKTGKSDPYTDGAKKP